MNEATTILLEVCKRYNYSDDTVIYQSMVIELNRGVNQAVVDAIQAKGVLARINRAEITKRSEADFISGRLNSVIPTQNVGASHQPMLQS